MTQTGPHPEGEHYFTAQPASAEQRRTVTVELGRREVTVEVAAGVFSSDGLDRGTRMFLDHVPDPPPTGCFLDLGCGWGPMALTLGLEAPDAQVWAVDVNRRALDLCARNAQRVGAAGVRARHPDDVPPDLRFDLIWSNPPIRVGKVALHDLLQTWLGRLTPTGAAYLVVAKSLGADSLQRWLSAEVAGPHDVVRLRATDKGFRLIELQRGP